MKIRMATMGLLTLAMGMLCAPGMMTADPAVERLSPAQAAWFHDTTGRKGRRYNINVPRSSCARHQNGPFADRHGRPYNRTQEVERRLRQAERARQTPEYLFVSGLEREALAQFNADQARALADIRRTDELTADAGLS